MNRLLQDARWRTSARRPAALGTLLAALMALCLGLGAAQAQAPKAPPPEQADARVRLLLDLLADEQVRSWLEKQRTEVKAKAKPRTEEQAEMSPVQVVAAQVDAVRQRLVALVQAAPRLPDELERAWDILKLELEQRGLVEIGLLVALFAGLGFGVERLFWWATRHIRPRIINAPMDTVGARGRAVLMRLAFGLSWTTAFAAGSIGAFLPFQWPPLIRDIVLAALIAVVLTRLASVIGRFLLAPGAERFRILPMATEAAAFWNRHLVLIVGIIAITYATVGLLETLGVSAESVRLFAAVVGLALLAIGAQMMLRRPPQSAYGGDVGADQGRGATTALVLLLFAVLWALRLTSQWALFWTVLVLAGVPAAIALTRRAVDHVLRPAGTADLADGTTEAAVTGIYNVCLERGLRALWIAIGALILANAWGVDLFDVGEGDSLGKRLTRSAISVVVILLVADFTWNLIKAIIDSRLAQPSSVDTGDRVDAEEARHRARVRTLLPILRNVSFIVFIVIVGLMALASLGVEIGPLIAGAGVVGVAVGFGAQTLVRDIISGIFYLFDDAFRIGEYIQSGNYKGTVESFSLRSIKLRHHRGPLYTIPFGTLGAVQNMSRDWVIDKQVIGVTYDTDLALAKKLVKEVGKELAEIPEFKPHILQTIKMQGVDNFGDFAINIRLKMMTRPGEQFVIRRHAFGMIKKAFDANGIKFAYPVVQVSGGDPGTAAAAARALAAMQEPAKAAT
ncbi:MAG: mechanosensitive ion channel family protein [Alphaproteobacteria bacterium]|nr:mechanosensitive ion channel family protein [Alphaproteobacteria bacterium]